VAEGTPTFKLGSLDSSAEFEETSVGCRQ